MVGKSLICRTADALNCLWFHLCRSHCGVSSTQHLTLSPILPLYPPSFRAGLMFINEVSCSAQPKPHLDGPKGLDTPMQFALRCVPGNTWVFCWTPSQGKQGLQEEIHSSLCFSCKLLPSAPREAATWLQGAASRSHTDIWVAFDAAINNNSLQLQLEVPPRLPTARGLDSHTVDASAEPSTQIPPRLYSRSARMGQPSGRGQAKKTG